MVLVPAQPAAGGRRRLHREAGEEAAARGGRRPRARWKAMPPTMSAKKAQLRARPASCGVVRLHSRTLERTRRPTCETPAAAPPRMKRKAYTSVTAVAPQPLPRAAVVNEVVTRARREADRRPWVVVHDVKLCGEHADLGGGRDSVVTLLAKRFNTDPCILQKSKRNVNVRT